MSRIGWVAGLLVLVALGCGDIKGGSIGGAGGGSGSGGSSGGSGGASGTVDSCVCSTCLCP